MTDFVFNISQSAKLRLENILQKDEAFVIDVTSGGCNGFSYKYQIAKRNAENLYCENPAILITQNAKDMLNGGILEYSADDFGTSFFSIKNPSATSKCGCGNSFSTF